MTPFNIKDVEVVTFSNSTNHVRMELEHLPTGQKVLGVGVGTSRHKLKLKLLKDLEEKCSG